MAVRDYVPTSNVYPGRPSLRRIPRFTREDSGASAKRGAPRPHKEYFTAFPLRKTADSNGIDQLS